MMAKENKRRSQLPNTGSEEIPPGATTRAADRPLNPGRGAPGSGAGPRHAANDPGTPDETYGENENNQPLADPTLEGEPGPAEQMPGYGGPSGGAVGGTPAEGRSKGGRTGGGLRPGTSRPDSTVGADPDEPTD
jgi:hypothetical protein